MNEQNTTAVEYVAMIEDCDGLCCGTGETETEALTAALNLTHSNADEIARFVQDYAAGQPLADVLADEFDDCKIIALPAGLLAGEPDPCGWRAYKLWCLAHGHPTRCEDGICDLDSGFKGETVDRVARVLTGLTPHLETLEWPEFPSREADVAQRRFLTAREALETFPHLIVDLDDWLAALALAYPAGKDAQDAGTTATFYHLPDARFYLPEKDLVALTRQPRTDPYVPVTLPRCCIAPTSAGLENHHGLRASQLAPVYLALLEFYRRAQADARPTKEVAQDG